MNRRSFILLFSCIAVLVSFVTTTTSYSKDLEIIQKKDVTIKKKKVPSVWKKPRQLDKQPSPVPTLKKERADFSFSIERDCDSPNQLEFLEFKEADAYFGLASGTVREWCSEGMQGKGLVPSEHEAFALSAGWVCRDIYPGDDHPDISDNNCKTNIGREVHVLPNKEEIRCCYPYFENDNPNKSCVAGFELFPSTYESYINGEFEGWPVNPLFDCRSQELKESTVEPISWIEIWVCKGDPSHPWPCEGDGAPKAGGGHYLIPDTDIHCCVPHI